MSIVSALPGLTKAHLYHAVGWGLRVYVACLVLAGLYSVLWIAELAGFLEERTLAVIWLSVAGMGSIFLVLLVPIYHTSRHR